MLKKLFAFGMATIMALGTTISAFAAEPVNPDPLSGKTLVSEERVPVQDENGNTFYVVISEYVDTEDVNVETRGMTPEYEVGTKKTFTVKIDNADLGNISNGVTISNVLLHTIAEIAATEIAKKVATAWIPGLNAATVILAFIQAGAVIAGVNGVRVIVDLEYSSVFFHKEGYYLYGWDITGASIDTY